MGSTRIEEQTMMAELAAVKIKKEDAIRKERTEKLDWLNH